MEWFQRRPIHYQQKMLPRVLFVDRAYYLFPVGLPWTRDQTSSCKFRLLTFRKYFHLHDIGCRGNTFSNDCNDYLPWKVKFGNLNWDDRVCSLSWQQKCCLATEGAREGATIFCRFRDVAIEELEMMSKEGGRSILDLADRGGDGAHHVHPLLMHSIQRQ